MRCGLCSLWSPVSSLSDRALPLALEKGLVSCWQAQAAPSCLLAALLPQGCFLTYVVMLSRLLFVASPTGIMEVKPGKPGKMLQGDQLSAECPPQVLMLLLSSPEMIILPRI